MAALIDRLRPELIQHFDSWVAPAAVEAAHHRPRSVQIIHANQALDATSGPITTHGTDLLVAVSDSAARYYPWHAGMPPLCVIRNGIDTGHYTPAAPPPASPPIRLLSVGRLAEGSKRLSTLVDACAELPESSWHLTLMGDGPDRDGLARHARDRRLCNVELPGHQDDPAPAYRAAHIYLSGALSEAFGRSLAEAAAAGLAILARHCHGVTDLLEDGVHALLARSDVELVQGLRRLISDGALRERLGRAARSFAVQNLDVARMVDAYESLYGQLLATPSIGRSGSGRCSKTETTAC
jgi:glycosyltransferase involved in cell wall biosynthesis